MPGSHQPCRAVERRPEIVAVALLSSTSVERHARTYCSYATPIARMEYSLCVERRASTIQFVSNSHYGFSLTVAGKQARVAVIVAVRETVWLVLWTLRH